MFSLSSGSCSNITQYDHPQPLFKVASLFSGHSLFSCKPRFSLSPIFVHFPLDCWTLGLALQEVKVNWLCKKWKWIGSARSESEVAQSCLTLATLWTVAHHAPPGNSWEFPGKGTGVGCHFLLQRIFPTQGSNPGLSHCRQTLYHLSHQGSPGTDYGRAIFSSLACQLASCCIWPISGTDAEPESLHPPLSGVCLHVSKQCLFFSLCLQLTPGAL